MFFELDIPINSNIKPSNIKLIPKPSFLSDKIAGREINVRKNAIANAVEKSLSISPRINQAKKTTTNFSKLFLREFFNPTTIPNPTIIPNPPPTTPPTTFTLASTIPITTIPTTPPPTTNIVIRFLIILLSCKFLGSILMR